MRALFTIFFLSFTCFSGLSQTAVVSDTTIYTFKLQLEDELPDPRPLKSKMDKAILRYRVLESDYKFSTYMVYITHSLPISKIITYGKIYNVKATINFKEEITPVGFYSSYFKYKIFLTPALFKLSFIKSNVIENGW